MVRTDISKLPKIKKSNKRHAFNLRIPNELWHRMVNEANLSWGEATQFILDAIKEKMDRMAKDK